MSAMDLDAIRFPGQQSDERVFLFLRRHWISFVPPFLIVLLMVVIPIVMSTFFGFLNFSVEGIIAEFFKSLGNAYAVIRAKQTIVFMYSSYYFFVASYFLVLWLDYYFDITIVTNERIIDIQQAGLFSRSVSELYLMQLQDISGKQKGLLQNLFNFGDVIIQTAGKKENFIIDHVAHSYQVSRKIMDLQEALMERKNKVDDSVEVG